MQWVRREIGRIANNLSTAYKNTATIKGDQTQAFNGNPTSLLLSQIKRKR